MLTWFQKVAPEIAPFNFGEEPLNAGQDALTQCFAVKGDLPLNITWSFSGLLTEDTSDVKTFAVGRRGSSLSIDYITPSHAGTYTCTVQNEAAIVSYSTVLVVNGIIPNSRYISLHSNWNPTIYLSASVANMIFSLNFMKLMNIWLI